MRALLLFTVVVSLSSLAGCLWEDSQTQVPPSECAATTNPKKCNESFKR